MAAKAFILIAVALFVGVLWAGYCPGDAVKRTFVLQRAAADLFLRLDDATHPGGENFKKASALRKVILSDLRALKEAAKGSDAERLNIRHRSQFNALHADVVAGLARYSHIRSD